MGIGRIDLLFENSKFFFCYAPNSWQGKRKEKKGRKRKEEGRRGSESNHPRSALNFFPDRAPADDVSCCSPKKEKREKKGKKEGDERCRQRKIAVGCWRRPPRRAPPHFPFLFLWGGGGGGGGGGGVSSAHAFL